MRPVDFRKFLREYYEQRLAEVDENLGSPIDKGETSLDIQLDRFLISYEKDSKSAKQESRDFRSFTREFLKEANEEAEGKKEDLPAVKQPTGDINVSIFAEHVVRLVDNYDSLLDVRDTIIRRAQKFLNDNYDAQVLSDFKSIMRDTFDVEVGVTDMDKQEKFQPPAAARAGKGTE